MSDDYGLDPKPAPGMNRIIRHNGCETCDGHRMIQVSEDPDEWARCKDCNPGPESEVAHSVGHRWWQE